MKKKHIIHLILLVIFLCSACISQQNHYPEKIFFIRLDCEYRLESISAKIENISAKEEDCIHQIIFDKARGGKTKLFGLFKIRESDAFEGKRLKILQGSKEVKNLSINELSNYKQDTIGLRF